MRKKGFRPIDVVAMATVLLLMFCQIAMTSSISVKWTNTGDDGNFGRLAKNEIYISRDSVALANNPYQQTRVPNVPVPTAPGTCQSAIITGLMQDSTYYMRIKSLDSDSLYAWGNWGKFVAPDTTAPAPIMTLMVGTCP
jgi:hypothetical protein